MTKGTWIATIVIGGAWWVLAAGCSEPLTKPAKEPTVDLEMPHENAVPPSEFYGSDANAHHIVYVIDRSGSMAPIFGEVQVEILKSINKLQATQNFSIIFFSENEFLQGPHKDMILASPENKLAASKFIEMVTPQGATIVLPALKHAIQLLEHADPRKPGRVIYLLSDGDFASMSGSLRYTTPDGNTFGGNEAVIQWLRDNNPKDEKGLIHVNTLLHLNSNKADIDVMSTIAKDSAGKFKLIAADD